MYGKLFQENKMVAFYSFAVFFLMLVGVFANNYRNTLDSQAKESSEIIRGCYYKLNCPPKENRVQSTFKCLPTLVCPTPTFIRPTVTKTNLTCNDCIRNRFKILCFNEKSKSAYCGNTFDKSAVSAFGTCVSCE